MTNRELNRDIKRLWELYKERQEETTDTSLWTGEDWFEDAARVEEMRTEWQRLWNADPEKTATSHKNLMRMIRINQTIRAEALHHIANYWKLD